MTTVSPLAATTTGSIPRSVALSRCASRASTASIAASAVRSGVIIVRHPSLASSPILARYLQKRQQRSRSTTTDGRRLVGVEHGERRRRDQRVETRGRRLIGREVTAHGGVGDVEQREGQDVHRRGGGR